MYKTLASDTLVDVQGKLYASCNVTWQFSVITVIIVALPSVLTSLVALAMAVFAVM